MLKRLLRHQGVQAVLGTVLAFYLRIVRATSRITIEPASLYDDVDPDLPVIVAMWHGEHFLVPFLKRPQHKVKVLISRHRDGELNALVAERFGLGLVRGSGSHGTQNVDKRGAAALIEMIRALEDGNTIAMTADVPKVAKVAGLGIVQLAKFSGRTIYPAAVVTSRHRVAERSWDKSKIPLPFGHIVIAKGDPVRVPREADEATLEQARLSVERNLNAINERAYAIAYGRAAPAP